MAPLKNVLDRGMEETSLLLPPEVRVPCYLFDIGEPLLLILGLSWAFLFLFPDFEAGTDPFCIPGFPCCLIYQTSAV